MKIHYYLQVMSTVLLEQICFLPGVMVHACIVVTVVLCFIAT